MEAVGNGRKMQKKTTACAVGVGKGEKAV